MKRTYVDIIGEYYENNNDLLDYANEFGLRDTDLRKVFRTRHSRKKQTLLEE